MSDKSADQLMDELKTLSNDDLRHRLSHEFNFNCGPITASTRSVYLKKLFKLVEERHESNEAVDDMHRNNGNSGDKPNEEELMASRVSSVRSSPSRARNSPRKRVDEDLPFETKTSTPKTRRQTSNAFSGHKKTSSTSKNRKSLAVMSEPAFVEPIGQSSTQLMNSFPTSLSSYSSESSENEDKIEDKILSKIRKSPRKKVSTPPTPRPLQEQLSASQRVPFARPYPPSFTPMSNASKLSTISSLTRPPLRRSPLLSGQPSANLANYSDSDDTEQEQNNDYIRDRLLRHRPGLNIGTISTTKATTQVSNGTGFEDTNNFAAASNWISFAILVIVILFFVFIFSFYFYTRISSSPKSAIDLTNFDFIREDLIAPLCQTNDDSVIASDYCLKYESDIMPALTIAKEIKSFVDKTIQKFYCGSALQTITSFNDFKSIPINEIKRSIRNSIQVLRTGREGFDKEPDAVLFDRDFSNAVTLLQLNPNWELRVGTDSINEVSDIRITDVYPLNLPFSCHSLLVLKLNSYKIFSTLLIIFLTFGSILYYKRSKKLATEEQDLVYDLVEKSLELLQSPDNPQSMPVLHIRDTLLSPSERKTSKYTKIWNKVVKHIESTESRVKVDIENIEGDDYKTWKWVAVSNSNNDTGMGTGSTIIRTGSIEWQGQAFNNDHNLNASQSVANNGALAAKPCFAAPTPFLKIRNMFDEETKLLDPNDWRNKIRSAVLEKIAIASKTGSHGVIHLEVEDSPEGLVYLKCNSIDSATDAFNGLHGWWCQKKLVSVKFLKPERYHQRFPASVHISTPLSTQ